MNKQIKMNERNSVEKPMLDQLQGLGWEILDLDRSQTPQQTSRENFAEVVMFPLLREQLNVINPWLENDQIDEAIKQLIPDLSITNLLENNRHVFNLLQENTSVSDNRNTGEKSPTVRFIDFKNPENNRFIAVCQFKIRILGTENHIFPDIVLFLNGLPVVVVECKSPKIKEPIPEASDQLLRYSEQRGAKGEGSQPLFFYNQFIVATCRNGEYIDQYTMRQSISDGVTLEIVYTGRTHNAEVPDQEGMDNAFADVFSEYNLVERLQILTSFMTKIFASSSC